MAIDLDQDIYGSSQNDVLNGGAGNDRMFGGAGNDVLNGGAGSDFLNAGSGTDVLLCNLSANSAAGTADTYMGGSGKDTLWLQFTRAEWLAHEVQSQLSAYLAHLAAVTNPTNGEVSNGTASDFVFTFGSSTLTVQMVENVRVWVDGVELTAANDLVTAVADAGSVLEDGPAVNIAVLANDSVPDQVAAVALASGPAHGTATLLQPNAADPSTWSFRYQANPADFQYLAKDQTATDSFTYTVTDADGNTGTATVTITITGTNDAPVVASADVTGAAAEMGIPSGNLTDSGAIAFTDADLTDVHSVGGVTASAGALGTLTASVSSDTTGTGTGGVVTWNYSVAAAAAEYLAAGETKTETFSFDVSDGQGGSVTRIVAVTLTGTNDAPVVTNTSDALLGAVKEDGPVTASGQLLASDVDHNATETWSVQGSAAGSYGSIAVDANGKWTYTLDNAAHQDLAPGESHDESFTVRVTDDQGAFVDQAVGVTVTGSNDAPVITNAATALVGAVQEDHQLTATGQLSAIDVDHGATQSWSVQGSSSGTYGSIAVDASGKWTYALDNAAHQDLAQGESHDESFTVRVTDDQGAFVDQAVKVTVSGTNDAPVITGGSTAGSVTEDAAVSAATGQLTALDPDHGATRTWAVQGSAPSGSADFHFAMDSLTITRNGSLFFQDNFSDGVAPPIGPDGTTVAYVGSGVNHLTESGGSAYFDGANAVPFVGVGSPDPIVGESLVVRSNLDPSNTTAGLKSTMDFTAAGVFDLLLPDRPREGFGIRLTDRLVGGNGTPPDQLGDSVVELRIGEGTDGACYAVLRKIDFAHDQITSLQVLALDPPAGTDQVRLNLSHAAANAGVVHGSVDYLQGGGVVGSQAFSATGLIFQGENWTRVEVIAAAPATNDSVLGGTYGSLVIDQSGKWTYDLDNVKAATQALAAGQHATDTFTVKVQDQFGAYDTRAIDVDVVGSNDAPVLQTSPVVARALAEDSNVVAGKLAATGEGQFADADLADTHAVSATLASAQLSSGDPLPASLAAALSGALTATLIDEATGDAQGGYHWDFGLDNAATQFLGAGQTLVLGYDLAVTDNNGASATQRVNLTVQGANDAPVITNPSEALVGAVQEDAQVTASGQLTAADVDHGSTQAWSVQGSATSAYGSVAVDANGKWTYTLDNAAHQNLAQGEAHDESFVLRVTDDQGAFADQTVTVTVSGTNDAPVITGSNGSPLMGEPVTENATAGVLVADVDATDIDGDPVTYYFKSGTGAHVQSDGNFRIDPATGVVTSARSFNYETSGTALHFTAYAGDGTAETAATYTVPLLDQAAAAVSSKIVISGWSGSAYNYLTGVDAQSFAITSVNGTGVTLQNAATGQYLFGLSGWTSFQFVVWDGAHYTSPGTVSLVQDSVWTDPETFVGTSGNDAFWLNQYATVQAGAGNDLITIARGNNVVYGGDGADTINIIWGGGNTVDGGAGADQISLENPGFDGFDRVVLRKGEAAGDQISNFGPGGDVLQLVGYGPGAILSNPGGGDTWQITDASGAESIRLVGVTSLAAGQYAFM